MVAAHATKRATRAFPLSLVYRILQSRKTNAVGVLGELIARKLLEQHYIVKHPQESKTGDLHCIDPATGEVVYIEVKTARRNKRGRWRFQLWKKGKTSHKHSDYFLLLAIVHPTTVIPFLVPTSEITSKSITISSEPIRYNGSYARYRQRSNSIRLFEAAP